MRRVAALGALMLSLAAAAPAPAEAAVRPCDREVKYRYDLTVTGMKSGHETFPPDSGFTGHFSLSYDYVARYPRVRVVVNRGCDPEIDTVRARATGTGTLRNYNWSDGVVPKEPSRRTPCAFGFTTDPLDVSLRVAGGTYVRGGGPSTFSVNSSLRLEAQEIAMIDLIDTRRRAACVDEGGYNFRVSDGLAMHRFVPIFERPARVGGLKVEPPGIFLDGSLRGGGRTNPRALARLVAGRSVRVSTGTRRYEGTDDESIATASTAVTLRFDRRR